MDGVLVVDKPQGLTSHDVVARVRRRLLTKRVGHLGTLDPMATGVLPLVLGRATRLASLLSEGDKVYRAVIRLGVTTETYDATGTVVEAAASRSSTALDRTQITAVTRRFTGTFWQTPPPYSAKKIRGVRAYRLARRRQPVEPAPVQVTVRSFEIEALEEDRLICRVVCSPGFYMRSLAHDLGNALGTGGCLQRLRRERSGSFTLAEAIQVDTLENDPRGAVDAILPLDQLLLDLASVVVTDIGSGKVAHGNALGPSDYADRPDTWPTGSTGDRVKVLDRTGKLLAIAESREAGALHPRIVLV